MAEAVENPMFAGEEPTPSSGGSGRTVGRPRSSGKSRSGGSTVRTAGVKTARGGSNMPRRPRNVKAGGGARLLAPLAIVVFALAGFVVLTGGDSDTTTPTEERSSSSETTSESNSSSESTTTTTTRSTYRVKPGDSFAAIAEKLNIDVDVLSELNPDVDPRALQPGQKLKLK